LYYSNRPYNSLDLIFCQRHGYTKGIGSHIKMYKYKNLYTGHNTAHKKHIHTHKQLASDYTKRKQQNTATGFDSCRTWRGMVFHR